ncbi:MAG TPA: GNAT family N-acetyltransferase [Gaiellaceae bacterium]|nr:GNAT family N-acetyltransferase [Gaiellaceae bacterium]
MTTPELRRVDPHGPEATALTQEFFAAVAARYPDFDPARQPPAPLEAFTPERGGAFLVASLEGALAGCGGLQRLDETTAEVRRVFVREAARRRGVARALVLGLVEAAGALGYRRVRLDTGDRLPEARALFTALGFRDIDDYNDNPFAAYWMELEL